MAEQILNNLMSSLLTAISSGDTSLTMLSGQGAGYPDVGGTNDYFYLALVEGTKFEIVQCTDRATDVFTIVRAQAGTTAQAFGVDAKIFPSVFSTAFDAWKFRNSSFVTATPSADQNDYNPTGFSGAAVLMVAPTASMRITGLVPTTKDRALIIQNTSTDFLLIIERENTASAAANRFTWPSQLPLFLMPGDSAAFVYDPTATRWRLQNSNRAKGGSQFDAFTDCFGIGASECGTVLLGGSGSAFAAGTYGVDATEKAYGVLEATTGSGSGSRAYLATSAQNVPPAQGCALFVTRCAPQQLSNGTQRFQLRAGFHDADGGSDSTDGAYWEYDDSVSALWRKVTSKASVKTKTTGTPTVATTYAYLGVFANADWTRIDYFYSTDGINFLFDGNITTNIPAVANLVSASVGINKSVGTSAVLFDVDLIGHRYDCARG